MKKVMEKIVYKEINIQFKDNVPNISVFYHELGVGVISRKLMNYNNQLPFLPSMAYSKTGLRL